ncbi:MAG: ABC transporter permease [Clostridia bacterium]|nr:ABC transporter permease [Clostridia bacterium]
MKNNKEVLQQWAELDIDTVDFNELEKSLEHELAEHFDELSALDNEREKIGNPNTLGETVMNVVWEQFLNQIAVTAGEDFIRENRGLTLDLSDDAHIQTPENFAKGKIAEHNHISRVELGENYKRYSETPHKEFRKEYVNPGMDATLERAGKLKAQGIDTVTDIYTGRQIPTETKFENGKNNPNAAQREHVKPSAENYENPSLQMGYSSEELADIINHPDNLQGYTTAQRNGRKSDKTANEMEDCDKTKHWEKANEKAEKHIKEKELEGEKRLIDEGRKTQIEETFRIGGKALKTVLMSMLASLVKDIIRKLIKWFRSRQRVLSTFIDSIKNAVKEFIKNMKQHLINAGDTLLTTIATAIIGPIVGMIKKAWIFLKQGYNSVKEAIQFLTDPNNANMSFSIKLLKVGKIIIAGLTAGGAILLGEVIETSLDSIPIIKAINIPSLGSLASLLGIFFGAVISGIIGALALDFIDRIVAKKLKEENAIKTFGARNGILATQALAIQVATVNTAEVKNTTAMSIIDRHNEAGNIAREIINKTDKTSTDTDNTNDRIRKLLNKKKHE